MLLVDFHAMPRREVLLNNGQLYDVLACMYATSNTFYVLKSGQSPAILATRQQFDPEHVEVWVCQEFDFYPGAIVTCDRLQGRPAKVLACLFTDRTVNGHEYLIEDQATKERVLVHRYELSRHDAPGLVDFEDETTANLLNELHSTLSV